MPPRSPSPALLGTSSHGTRWGLGIEADEAGERFGWVRGALRELPQHGSPGTPLGEDGLSSQAWLSKVQRSKLSEQSSGTLSVSLAHLDQRFLRFAPCCPSDLPLPLAGTRTRQSPSTRASETSSTCPAPCTVDPASVTTDPAKKFHGQPSHFAHVGRGCLTFEAHRLLLLVFVLG